MPTCRGGFEDDRGSRDTDMSCMGLWPAQLVEAVFFLKFCLHGAHRAHRRLTEGQIIWQDAVMRKKNLEWRSRSSASRE
ncbi:MAG: hypothetical protein K0Q55_1779 [Verrucomicrobia bacterium]|nr:hypothetical protein [Verrucomicrobiota bacterium]